MIRKSAYKAFTSGKSYEDAASKGRFGDDDIRIIHGTPQHVNQFEAGLIDEFGKEGEDFVDKIGSGTINPETGLEENWLNVAIAIGAAIVGTSAVSYAAQNDWSLEGMSFGDVWNYTLGNQGVGGLLTDKEGRDAMQNAASGTVGKGLVDLRHQAEDMLGTGTTKGTIAEGADINRGQAVTDSLTKNLSFDNAVSKSGLAGSGAINMQQNIQNREYTNSMAQIDFQEKSDRQNYLTDVKREARKLQMDYMQATGDEYGGSDELDYLEDLFDNVNV